MQKLFCAITGDKYTWVLKDTPESQKKIQALAIAVLVPTLLWLFNGFLLAYKVLQTGFFPALVIGVGCAVVIFIVEKLIVMSSNGFWIGVLRMAMGIAIALIGSIAVDEALFHNDINNQLEFTKADYIKDAKQAAHLQFAEQHGLDSLKNEVTERYAEWTSGMQLTINEVDGLNNSPKGYGRKAEFKNSVAQEKKTQYNTVKVALDKLMADQRHYTDSVGKQAASRFNAQGLLVRLEAMFMLIQTNFYVRVVYFVFTFIFFCLELIVIIFKLSWKKSNYERKLQLIEQLGEQRFETLRHHRALQDPAYDYAQTQIRGIERVSYSSFKR